jgi:hypothetical protein
MKKFVLATGALSAISGLAIQFPRVAATLSLGANPPLAVRVFGLVAIFLGLLLFLCSRDLRHRGAIVAWEGVLRLVGGLLISCYGAFGGHGVLVGLAGLGDLMIGVVYLALLPRHLGCSAADLLLDRPFPEVRSV